MSRISRIKINNANISNFSKSHLHKEIYTYRRKRISYRFRLIKALMHEDVIFPNFTLIRLRSEQFLKERRKEN